MSGAFVVSGNVRSGPPDRVTTAGDDGSPGHPSGPAVKGWEFCRYTDFVARRPVFAPDASVGSGPAGCGATSSIPVPRGGNRHESPSCSSGLCLHPRFGIHPRADSPRRRPAVRSAGHRFPLAHLLVVASAPRTTDASLRSASGRNPVCGRRSRPQRSCRGCRAAA